MAFNVCVLRRNNITMIFALVVLAIAVMGGGMTALAGAGTGSMLVPLFGYQFDFKLAVAAVAVPHLSASAVRAFRLRHDIDQSLFFQFGLVCAVASLIGALVHTQVTVPVVAYLFAILLVIAGVLGLTGLAERIELGRKASWIGGAVSGFFGGLAGEQGGFRAIALLGFDLRKETFVATSTAVAVLIDVVRTPVYWFSQWDELQPIWGLIGLATAGAVAGTFVGEALPRRVSQKFFIRVVSGIILMIGVLLFLREPS